MWMFVLLGALLGFAVDDFGGLVFGMACGWLLARQLAQGRELQDLRQQLQQLRPQGQASPRPADPDAAPDVASSVALQASPGAARNPLPQAGADAADRPEPQAEAEAWPTLADIVATVAPEPVMSPQAGSAPAAAPALFKSRRRDMPSSSRPIALIWF